MKKFDVRDPIYAIPDDPERSVYRFVIVASKRARQLQAGARSLLHMATRKPTVTAMEEVRRGLIKYWDPEKDKERTSEEFGLERL